MNLEEKIVVAIESLTGLSPREDITEGRYCLSLGTVDPLEIGYDKSRKALTEERMRYSALVKMLEVVAQMMMEIDVHDEWLRVNKK